MNTLFRSCRAAGAMVLAVGLIGLTPTFPAHAQPPLSSSEAPAPPTTTDAPGLPADQSQGPSVQRLAEGDPSTDPDYPAQDFYTSGFGTSGTNVWQELGLTIGSKLCRDPFNLDCDVTDRLDVSVKITMSSQYPLIQWSSTYDPRNYYYNSKHLEIIALSNGREQFRSNCPAFGDGTGFKCNSYNGSNLAGKPLEIAVRFWAMNADGDYETVGAKTDVAQCDPVDPADPPKQNGTICRFS